MPHKKLVVEYLDGQIQFKVPFIMYADFESVLEPISGPGDNPRISTTRDINVHIPSAWCIRSELAYGEVKDPLELYRGKDCARKFCDLVTGEAHCLYGSFPEKPMEPSTLAQWKDYKHVNSCHICLKPFREGKPKVRDHCHDSGIYRGVPHLLCNLQYKISSYIPVVFHNLLGYDADMLIKELAFSSPNGAKMGVIAKNKEDYITFLISVEVNKYINKDGEEHRKEIKLRFIDSFKFMSSSLDSLVNNLAHGNNTFFGFEDYNMSQYKLLIEKEYIPMYIWMIGINLKKPSSLLRKLSIVNSPWLGLTKKINNLGEYHDFYLHTVLLANVVVLLANVIEAFRSLCSDNYGLYPDHFCITPGLAWKTYFKEN